MKYAGLILVILLSSCRPKYTCVQEHSELQTFLLPDGNGAIYPLLMNVQVCDRWVKTSTAVP